MKKTELIDYVRDILSESLQGYNTNHEWHYIYCFNGSHQKIGSVFAYQYDVYDNQDPGDRSDELDEFVKDVLPDVAFIEVHRGNSWSNDDSNYKIIIEDNLADLEKIRRRVRDFLNKAPADVVLQQAVRLGVKLS